MERSSGLKECPRCGLKNRAGAGQCDFCGWDFNAASDEWINQVADLEKVSRQEDDSKLDARVQSRIELTMKDPSDVPVVERPPVKESREEAERIESPGDLLTAATMGGMPETVEDTIAEPVAITTAEPIVEHYTEPPAEPTVEPLAEPTPMPEPIPVPEPPAPAVNVPSAEPPAETVAPEMETALPEQVAAPEEKEALSVYIIPSAMIAIGLAIYALAIFLTVTQDISRIIGWGLAIIASTGLVLGTIRLWPLLKKGKAQENEVVICPACHEVVSDSDDVCPACGVKFKGA